MENKEKLNIFSRYYLVTIIFLLSLIVYFVAGKFCFNNIANNVSIYDRASNSEHKNIVFGGAPSSLNSYMNFNGSFYAFDDDKRLLADIFMISNDSEYTDNYISNKIDLKKGECAVSSNLLKGKSNNKIFISELEKECSVKYTLPPQSGLDPIYNYNGVIILGYDENALKYNHSYVYITNEVDYIVNATGYKYLDEEQEKAKDIIIKNCFYIMMSGFILIIILESLISRRRYNDYRINKREGMKTSKLARVVYQNFTIQYLLPFAICFIVYYLKFSFYGQYILFPLFWYLLMNIVILLIIGVEYIRRSCKWKTKK